MPSPPEYERADRRTVQRNVQVERWGGPVQQPEGDKKEFMRI